MKSLQYLCCSKLENLLSLEKEKQKSLRSILTSDHLFEQFIQTKSLNTNTKLESYTQTHFISPTQKSALKEAAGQKNCLLECIITLGRKGQKKLVHERNCKIRDYR